MISQGDALQLLDYDRWANTRMAKALAKAQPAQAEALRLWAHVIASQETWLERVQSGPLARNDFWPEPEAPAELARRFESVQARWRELLLGTDAAVFARKIEFKNSRGEACAS